MASGYPDFFGLSVFPNYGSSTYKQGGVPVSGAVSQQIFAISGKGILIGGIVYIDDTDFDDDALFYVLVDSQYLPVITVADYLKYNLYESSKVPLAMLYYNPSIGRVCFSFSLSLTFQSVIGLYVIPNSAGVYSVNYLVYYTPIL